LAKVPDVKLEQKTPIDLLVYRGFLLATLLYLSW